MRKRGRLDFLPYQLETCLLSTTQNLRGKKGREKGRMEGLIFFPTILKHAFYLRLKIKMGRGKKGRGREKGRGKGKFKGKCKGKGKALFSSLPTGNMPSLYLNYLYFY